MRILRNPGAYYPDICKDTFTYVLAGGRGTRLYDLTKMQAKPATFFGGKYRIIDFTLSNCIHSGMHRIAVMTQYNSFTLIAHIQRTWQKFTGELGAYIGILPADQKQESHWYKGTADAIRSNLRVAERIPHKHALILSGDHIYAMNYQYLVQAHVDTNADITLACIPVPVDIANQFGVVKVSEEGRIQEFIEKPDEPLPFQDHNGQVLASMGIYVFKTELLQQLLHEDALDPLSSHDFGMDVLPKALSSGLRICAYKFVDSKGQGKYWRDVGTVDGYFNASMELLMPLPRIDLYDECWPFISYEEHLPSAKLVRDQYGHPGSALDSILAAGTIVSGADVTRSVVCYSARIGSRAEVHHCVLLPNVIVNERVRLNHCIVDEECEIPAGTVIGEDPELDAERYLVTENGVVIVTAERLNS